MRCLQQGVDCIRSRHVAAHRHSIMQPDSVGCSAKHLNMTWHMPGEEFLPYLIMPKLLQVRPLALQGDAGLVHPQHELHKVVCFLLDKHECCSSSGRSSGAQAGTGLRLCRCATLLTLQQCGPRVKAAITALLSSC